MKRRRIVAGWLRFAWAEACMAGCLVLLGVTQMSHAEAVRTQELLLSPGWNAVFLEVDPGTTSPEALFADVPIDVVATHSSPLQGSQFVSDPTADVRGAYGWAVWYAPHRADHVLSNLFAVQGGKAYLLHCTTNVTWSVTGTLPQTTFAWTPNAYQFVGFGVDPEAPPTFAQFFAGSAAHQHDQIYRLVDGVWKQVTDPAATLMHPGEAFWMYTRGRSSYQGPLDVKAESLFGVMLTGSSGSELVFRNQTSFPLDVVLEHVVDGDAVVPMAIEVPTFDRELPGFRTVTVVLESGAWQQSLPTLEAGKGVRLPLSLHAAAAQTGAPQHSYLRIRTDMGTVQYLPVTAVYDTSAPAPESTSP